MSSRSMFLIVWILGMRNYWRMIGSFWSSKTTRLDFVCFSRLLWRSAMLSSEINSKKYYTEKRLVATSFWPSMSQSECWRYVLPQRCLLSSCSSHRPRWILPSSNCTSLCLTRLMATCGQWEVSWICLHGTTKARRCYVCVSLLDPKKFSWSTLALKPEFFRWSRCNSGS